MINGVNTDTAAASAAGSLTGTGKSGAMGKDEFLRLLVTQLSNQDPLNPLQGHEFAAQLAQFSSVEQLVNIEARLGEASEMNGLVAANVNNGVAAGLIGKQIEANGNVVGLSGEGGASFDLNLESAAADVKITIRNEAGDPVQTLDLGAVGKGTRNMSWNGDGQNGWRMPTGNYTVEVQATDQAGDTVGSLTSIHGKVDRVTFGANGIQLWIGNNPVSMAAVQSVGAE